MYTWLCRGTTLVLGIVLLQSSVAQAGDEVLLPLSERFGPQATTEEVPSFERHVSPLLGRLGCNGRACHGSFQGRGGFQLSLFGYDFAADHKALTASEKPRVNLASPAESMILNKPTNADVHEGGERYKKDGWEYQVLLRWIVAGSKDDSADHAKLTRLEVIPAEITFTQDEQQTGLRAIAHWADGVKEDVTPLCRFKSNDTEVADVSEAGQVKSLGQGDTHIIVFYDNGITPVPVLRPVSAEAVAAYPAISTPTKIDELVVAKLRRLGIVPAETSSDAEFLRRVSLDVTGTLPAPQEVEAFLADATPDKRARKVDELLERPGYAAWWATRLCDITGNNPKNAGNNAFRDMESRQWYDWIHARIEKNVPYDELIAGIVEATGRKEAQSLEDYCREMTSYVVPEGEANFADRESMPHYWSQRTKRKPEEKALSFAHAFLGVRIECAQCHKHPFDQWSKKDFEEFTSFFAGIQYGTPNGDKKAYKAIQEANGMAGKKNNELNKLIPQLVKEGKMIPFQEVYVSLKAPNNNKKKKNEKKADDPTFDASKARVLGGELISFQQGDDPRKALMDWMRQQENPYFAKAIVNRVWAAYFNVGIIEPADDLSLANPPSNAPLLDWLTREFVAHKYDLKWLHKTIVTSNTYQASWRTNPTNELDARNFSHAVMRRMPAEVAVDAMKLATAADSEIVNFQTGIASRAIGPGAGYEKGQRGQATYALATFGKPARETNCDCERSQDPSLLQTLYLRNDREMLAMIDRRGGWLESIAREYKLAFDGVAAPEQEGKKGKQAKAALKLSAAQKSQISKELLDKQTELAQRLKKMNQQLAQAKKQNDKDRLKKIEERQKKAQAQLVKVEKQIAQQLKQQATKTIAEGTPPEPETDNELVGKQPPVVVAEVAAPVVEKAALLDANLQAELIKQVYLRSLSRLPSEAEQARATAHLRDAKDPMSGLRDIFWAVLNTKEFIVNH
jgi:hypothetical protein